MTNKALEYLKEIEWMDDKCPVCQRWRADQHGQWCRLDKAIGVLAKQSKAGEQQINRQHYEYVQGLRATIDHLEAQLPAKDEEIGKLRALLQM